MGLTVYDYEPKCNGETCNVGKAKHGPHEHSQNNGSREIQVAISGLLVDKTRATIYDLSSCADLLLLIACSSRLYTQSLRFEGGYSVFKSAKRAI